MIRVAIGQDVPAIRRLMERVPGFWQPWWSDRTIGQGILSANGLSFLWEDQSRALGFVCAHDLSFRAYLSELVVDPDARHLGIATGLIATVEGLLCKQGQRILIADVRRSHSTDPCTRRNSPKDHLEPRD